MAAMTVWQRKHLSDLKHDVLALFSKGWLVVDRCECEGKLEYENGKLVVCPICHGTGFEVREGHLWRLCEQDQSEDDFSTEGVVKDD